MFQLDIDGKTVIKTDTTWNKYDSPILFSDLYDGEIYDSRLENCYQNCESVKIFDYGFENLVWNSGSFVRISQKIPAKRIIKTPKGQRINPKFTIPVYLPKDAKIYEILKKYNGLDEIDKIHPNWL